MKKLFFTLVLALIFIGGVYAEHFIVTATNNYLPMNIWVYGAQVLGTELSSGDEIGIFDGTHCVGAAVLTGPISGYPNGLVPIIVNMEEDPGDGGAVEDNPIIYKIWHAGSSTEYSYPGDVCAFSVVWWVLQYNFRKPG